ncbi:pyrroline-5-carboxylate reductase family protein, partial [Enterococcus faecium]
MFDQFVDRYLFVSNLPVYHKIFSLSPDQSIPWHSRYEYRLLKLRVMPNVNVSVGAGVSAICKNEAATEEQLQQATMIFEAIGSV